MLKLYNYSNLKDNFDCSAWISVSKEYNIKDLLQRTIKSSEIPTIKEEWDMLHVEEDFEKYIRKYLKGRRTWW